MVSLFLTTSQENEKLEWTKKLEERARQSREDLTIESSPHFVNISADPSLSGVLLYLIRVRHIENNKLMFIKITYKFVLVPKGRAGGVKRTRKVGPGPQIQSTQL